MRLSSVDPDIGSADRALRSAGHCDRHEVACFVTSDQRLCEAHGVIGGKSLLRYLQAERIWRDLKKFSLRWRRSGWKNAEMDSADFDVALFQDPIDDFMLCLFLGER